MFELPPPILLVIPKELERRLQAGTFLLVFWRFVFATGKEGPDRLAGMAHKPEPGK